jgi:hypothetical protein
LTNVYPNNKNNKNNNKKKKNNKVKSKPLELRSRVKIANLPVITGKCLTGNQHNFYITLFSYRYFKQTSW